MNFKYLALPVSALLLCGCASTVSVADLRIANEGHSVLQTKMSYENAYKVIASESRRCFERTLPGATVSVRADLYAESKKGEISIAGALMNSSIAEVLFEIQALDSGASEVRTYYRKKSSESVERAMRAWLGGDTAICHIEKS